MMLCCARGFSLVNFETYRWWGLVVLVGQAVQYLKPHPFLLSLSQKAGTDSMYTVR